MIVFPAHCNFFPKTSSRGENAPTSCFLAFKVNPQSTGSSCKCCIRLYNSYHKCTSSTNEYQKWNLTCGGSTVCLHMPDKCMKCDLGSMQETSCGDVVLTLVKSNSRLKVTCKEKRYPLNSKSLKTGRCYKKCNNNPEPKQSKNFYFCKFLRIIGSTHGHEKALRESSWESEEGFCVKN